jgi:hypothetical protein
MSGGDAVVGASNKFNTISPQSLHWNPGTMAMPRSEGEGRHALHLTPSVKVKQVLRHSMNVSKTLPHTLPDISPTRTNLSNSSPSQASQLPGCHCEDNDRPPLLRHLREQRLSYRQRQQRLLDGYSLSTTSTGNWKFGCKAEFAVSITKIGRVAHYINGANTISRSMANNPAKYCCHDAGDDNKGLILLTRVITEKFGGTRESVPDMDLGFLNIRHGS